MPQVSVIIPTRNRGEYLGAALKSVLGQRFGDFEVIVVDDAGSAGGTGCAENCRDPRVRLLRHAQRRGGAAARNTGIAAARAPYIAFLDDDDEWYPDKLALQMGLIESRPAHVGAVYSGYHIVQGERILGQMIPAQSGKLGTALMSENLIGGTSSVLARRRALDDVGGFDERLASFQDYDLWLRLAQKYDFECISAPLLKYRVHGRKIWTDLGALESGLDLMLQKYGAHPAFQKKSSRYYLSLGIQYCRRDDLPRGLEALRKAIRLDPYGLRSYFYLAAAMVARRNFDRLVSAKERVFAGMMRR